MSNKEGEMMAYDKTIADDHKKQLSRRFKSIKQ